MTVPRRLLVDQQEAGFYHCISRCVRRAFLCGDEFDHRRHWIQRRLRTLAGIFAIDVAGYAVMSNHVHAVLWTDPDRVRGWSDREVALRWLRLFPPPRPEGVPRSAAPDPAEVAALVAQPDRIALLRRRLADLSWFMRCLKEPIARRANREDGCTGRFWEGRFRCHRLLDEAAVLACCVYVDLNLVRARMARTAAGSNHTSAQDRIHVRRRYEKLAGRLETAPRRADGLIRAERRGAMPRDGEDGIWLARIEAKPDGSHRGIFEMSVDEYVAIVESTARAITAPDAPLEPEIVTLLDRLQIDPQRWLTALGSISELVGTAIGSVANRMIEAARRGARWVIGALDVYQMHAVSSP